MSVVVRGCVHRAWLLGALLGLGACSGSEDPLMEAARSGDQAKVAELISAGADLNADFSKRKHDSEGGWWYRGSTPLVTAACHGEDEIVEQLVEGRAKIDAPARVKLITHRDDGALTQEAEGWSALLCAAWYGEFYAVEALLEAGADVNARDPENETALIKAAQMGKADIVRILTEARADLGARGEWKRTALHWAVANDQVESVTTLIEARTPLSLVDSRGDTPLDLARSDAVRSLLKDAGARRSKEL